MALSRNSRISVASVVLGLLAVTACDEDDGGNMVGPEPDPEPANIIETAEAAGSFSTLLAAVEAAGLRGVLEGPGPFTVFAPTDEAFSRVPDDVIFDLLGDTDLLTAVLTYHVLPGLVPADVVVRLTSTGTVNGKNVDIDTNGDGVFIDGIPVVTTDIEASNGIIHVIDGVLTPEPIANIPQTAREAGGFDTLLAAVEAAGLAGVLSGPGPFTVFAPTDEAFAQIPAADLQALLDNPQALAEILTYHVVTGTFLAQDVVALDTAATVNGANVQIRANAGSVRVNDANVVATDILTRNGVIHVIDQVLIP